MTRRFVILIDSDATAEERNAVTQHFMNSELYGFWHHFQFSWLVTTSDETVTASDLRDEIKDKLTGTSIIVIRIDGAITWTSYATDLESKWLYGKWDTD